MTIEVISNRSSGTKLGIEVPREVTVLRDNDNGVEDRQPTETMTDEISRLRSLQSSAQAGFGTINAMIQRMIDHLVEGMRVEKSIRELRIIQEAVLITFETLFKDGTGYEIAVVDGNKNERRLLGSVLG